MRETVSEQNDIAVEFFVPGLPVAQGRPRAFKTPAGHIAFYDPKTSKDWKTVVAKHAPTGLTAIPAGVAISLSLAFSLKAPKSMKTLKHHTSKPDIDNLVKAVKDALTGIIWNDDSQVNMLTASKSYASPGAEGVLVIVKARV